MEQGGMINHLVCFVSALLDVGDLLFEVLQSLLKLSGYKGKAKLDSRVAL